MHTLCCFAESVASGSGSDGASAASSVASQASTHDSEGDDDVGADEALNTGGAVVQSDRLPPPDVSEPLAKRLVAVVDTPLGHLSDKLEEVFELQKEVASALTHAMLQQKDGMEVTLPSVPFLLAELPQTQGAASVPGAGGLIGRLLGRRGDSDADASNQSPTKPSAAQEAVQLDPAIATPGQVAEALAATLPRAQSLVRRAEEATARHTHLQARAAGVAAKAAILRAV